MIWVWIGLVLSFLAVVACFVSLLLIFGLWAFVLAFSMLFFLLMGSLSLHKIVEHDYFINHW